MSTGGWIFSILAILLVDLVLSFIQGAFFVFSGTVLVRICREQRST